RQAGNDLELSIIGTNDKLTLNSWYAGSGYHVEEFRTSDGHVLIDTMVQNLVQAMASFAPPPAGQTTLPQDHQNSLAPLLAANWK
ncbi:MAG TPA: calcium-binding protein, partial [Variovorax sp.]|nr:calcium-binding protein [Variovorax sp.]